MKFMRRRRTLPASTPTFVGSGLDATRLLRGIKRRSVLRGAADAADTWSWRLGWGIIIMGTFFVGGSLWGDPTLANVGLSFGTGLALAGVVLLLERHLLSKVGEAFDKKTAP